MRWGGDIFDPLTTNMSGHIFAQIQAVTYLKWKISLPTIFMTLVLKGTMIDLVHFTLGKRFLDLLPFELFQRFTQNIGWYFFNIKPGKQGHLAAWVSLQCVEVRVLKKWNIGIGPIIKKTIIWEFFFKNVCKFTKQFLACQIYLFF